MTETHFKTQLHSLIRLQRTAQTLEGFPDAEMRRDRLTRAAAILARSSDAIAGAVSADFGNRSIDETRFEIFGALNALRNAAAKVENWMQAQRRYA